MAVKERKQRTPKATRPNMPDYGVSERAKGLLPWKWAEDRLRKSHQYWIATVRPDGRPHVMVIWGLWHDGEFYFSTGETSRKVRNLKANPWCVIGSERAEQAVIVEGRVEPVTDAAVRKSVSKSYGRKYKMDMEGFAEPMYVVRPHVAFGLWEAKFVNTATRWQFGD
jgi:nitroimidazol reductase NimA-like FMN-containing flavoprotein (pyridoxamine 5'-phosphate oxidase superfamily)